MCRIYKGRKKNDIVEVLKDARGIIHYLIIAVADGVGGGVVRKIGSLVPLAFMDLIAGVVSSRTGLWKAQDHIFL